MGTRRGVHREDAPQSVSLHLAQHPLSMPMPFHITSWCAQLLVHANRLMDHYNCMLPVVLAAPDCPYSLAPMSYLGCCW